MFSEKLVVHAYHLAGYYRLEAIAQNSEQTLLSYKVDICSHRLMLLLVNLFVVGSN